MANTHEILILGEGPHFRGNPLVLMPPASTQQVGLVLSGGNLPQANTILRGATTAAVARVVRLVPGSPGAVIAEMIGSFFGDDVPGAAFGVTTPFVGEIVNMDTGGTAVVSPFATASLVPGQGQFPSAKLDAELLTLTPPDGLSDGILYHRQAKIGRALLSATASYSPAGIGSFKKGDRITTSSGGSFTLLGVSVVGSDYAWVIVRQVGAINQGDVLTNTTAPRAGNTATLTTLLADTQLGTWCPHSLYPQLSGPGGFYEIPPWGDAQQYLGGIGMLGSLSQAFYNKYKDDPDPTNRGVRVLPFATWDNYAELTCTGAFGAAWQIGETIASTYGWTARLVDFDVAAKVLWVDRQNGFPFHGGVLTGQTSAQTATFGNLGSTFETQPLLGGVTVQTIRCTGTFPTTWTIGETVNAVVGTWSGKVHGWNATLKHLFVTNTNGQTLQTGGITGATSGAIATNRGAAYGWQKGSRFWTEWLQEVSTGRGRPGALYMSAARRLEGIVVSLWESEVLMFSPGGQACPWPSFEAIGAAWVQLLRDMRTEFADPELPISLFMHDIRSQSAGAQIGGLPFSLLVNAAFVNIVQPSLARVTLINTTGMQPAQSTPLPYTTNWVFLRPEDYWELGRRAWRALEFAQWQDPLGPNKEGVPCYLDIGHSWATGAVAAAFAFLDRDPDLYPSETFPGVDTLDENVIIFNHQQHDLLPYDVANNTGGFKNPDGFGTECALTLRAKKRFRIDPALSSRIVVLKLCSNGSSAHGAVDGVPMTFDPGGASNWQSIVGSCIVTPLAADSLNPVRGRFTGAPGAFSTNFIVGGHIHVTGSALGNFGLGGNNTLAWQFGTNVWAIAPDRSWIEVAGAFVAEGPLTLTFVQGPYAAVQDAEAAIRQLYDRANELGIVLKPVGIKINFGENDFPMLAEIQAALVRLGRWARRVFAPRIKGEADCPIVIVETPSHTGWAVSDEDVAAMITAQRAAAAELGTATTVNTSKLPMESKGIWPRTTRLHNGVHPTPRGTIMLGYLCDEAFETLGWPPHPDGSAALDFGVPGGEEEPSAPSGPIVPAGPGSAVPLIVEDGTGMPDSDSYVSLAEAETMLATIGTPTEWDTATDEFKTAWLRVAARSGVDFIFGAAWSGIRNSETQSLDWPRDGAYDRRSRWLLLNTVIPRDVKWAQVYYALALALGMDPLADFDVNDSDQRNLYATSYTDQLPGGLSESKSFAKDGAGIPKRSVLYRMHAAATPFLRVEDDSIGVAG